MQKRVRASFRDPDGFVYRRDGLLLRQVNTSYAEHYGACKASGLYDRLIADGLLIPHAETGDPGIAPGSHCVLMPEELPYVSYPYEWCFSQLKDAALLTLEIQRKALEHGLTLKDASAYNVQFRGGRPIFIDSLSFERYVEGRPWAAYRQFCQHFLAPLTLMAAGDARMRQLQSRYIDGLPLDLVSRMLPASTYLRYSTLAHIHLHARSQKRHEDDARTGREVTPPRLSKRMLGALLESLVSAVEGLSLKEVGTEWGEYYSDTNYSPDAMRHKEEVVALLADGYLRNERIVHDLGANTGRFSRIVAARADQVVAHDVDEIAVERHYLGTKADGCANILPLVLDLTNPSPRIGWDLDERSSFHDRARNSAAVALALVHHLCISNNVPLDRLADFFAGLFRTLIIEFVPKEDSQVRRLLATRPDVFPGYDEASFEAAFARRFRICERHRLKGSARTLYAMTRRDGSR